MASRTPNSASLKATPRMNLIKNTIVTTEDMQLAEKSHGPDLGGIKSKSTRSKPIAVRTQVIEMLDEILQVNEEISSPKIMKLRGILVDNRRN